MNRVFVDTSAIVALLVPTDGAHARSVEIFDRHFDDEGLPVLG